MNEQIRELMEQAGLYDFVVESMGINEELEKFAELIVRECANQCDLLLDHKISSEWARGTHDCSKAIKKHFGVEDSWAWPDENLEIDLDGGLSATNEQEQEQ